MPEFLLEHYILTHVEKTHDRYHVYLEEKNDLAKDSKKRDLLSKGFFPPLPYRIFQYAATVFFFTLSAADGSIPKQAK